MAGINRPEKADYEAPRAMRLQPPAEGMGACDGSGSGDAECLTHGQSASLMCVSHGESAGDPGAQAECILDGNSANPSCSNTGNAATALCNLGSGF